ncbi:VOC family protein [Amycolatopsis sp. WAC 01375]|uniref:VOC family protein n=1 Tax=Amycolatopsis sp. WAC 01375 TaxID=2203194 RepID=UPI0018F3E8AC|nr:VOC family protein [Amycolatopsis sp. WAC 01375]
MTRPFKLVNTLHPRLLVDDFAAVFRFYDTVLPQVIGAKLAEGSAEGPYARWDTDLDRQPAIAVLDRAAMTGMLAETTGSTGDQSIIVLRLADVDIAQNVFTAAGATIVSAAAARPEWGSDVRIAYLRDPAGTLVELQASPD